MRRIIDGFSSHVTRSSVKSNIIHTVRYLITSDNYIESKVFLVSTQNSTKYL